MGTILTKLWDSVHRDGQLNARQNRLFLNSLKGNDRTYGTPAWRGALLPTHMVLAVLLTALPLASSPASAGEVKPDKSGSKSNFMFGQMFPHYPLTLRPTTQRWTHSLPRDRRQRQGHCLTQIYLHQYL